MGGKIRIVYAGLLGVAQGVLKLCEELDYSNIELHIYGSGAEQIEIESFIINNPELPIVYHGELTRHELHKVLPQFDIAIIPLLNRIYGSVPSKIFEYAKLGLPILYFGGGEGEMIVRENKLGWIAEAGDYDNLNSTILKIEKNDLNINFKEKIKQTADANFDFEAQLERLAKII